MAISLDDPKGIINFVHKFLHSRYRVFYEDPNLQEDLVSYCLVSLYSELNVNPYDPTKYQLESYATKPLIGGVKKFIMNLKNETSEERWKIRNKINKAKETLENDNSSSDYEAISYFTGLNPGRMMKIINSPDQVELTYDGDIEKSIKDSFLSPEDQFLKKEALDEVLSFLNKLSPTDRTILKNYITYLDEHDNDVHMDKKTKDKVKLAQAHARIIRDGFSAYSKK